MYSTGLQEEGPCQNNDVYLTHENWNTIKATCPLTWYVKYRIIWHCLLIWFQLVHYLHRSLRRSRPLVVSRHDTTFPFGVCFAGVFLVFKPVNWCDVCHCGLLRQYAAHMMFVLFTSVAWKASGDSDSFRWSTRPINVTTHWNTRPDRTNCYWTEQGAGFPNSVVTKEKNNILYGSHIDWTLY